MYAVYAALAIVQLKADRDQKCRLTEDEFYAQYGEAPWSRFKRLARFLLARLPLKREPDVVCRANPVQTCGPTGA